MLKTETLFELTELSKIYHMTTIAGVAMSMEEKLEAFAVHNPDKKELIESRKQSVVRLKEAEIFISKLFMALETEKKKNIDYKIKNTHAENVIDILKKGIEDCEKKYNGLIEFDKK